MTPTSAPAAKAMRCVRISCAVLVEKPSDGFGRFCGVPPRRCLSLDGPGPIGATAAPAGLCLDAPHTARLVAAAAAANSVLPPPQMWTRSRHLLERTGEVRLIDEPTVQRYFAEQCFGLSHQVLSSLNTHPGNESMRRFPEAAPKDTIKVARAEANEFPQISRERVGGEIRRYVRFQQRDLPGR
jgi:hypothetical protein